MEEPQIHSRIIHFQKMEKQTSSFWYIIEVQNMLSKILLRFFFFFFLYSFKLNVAKNLELS